MAKKKSEQKKSKTLPKKKGSLNALWITGAVALAIVGLVLFVMRPSGEQKGKSFSVEGGETRPLLSPSLFTGRAQAAYAAANNYPEVMDQVFCYCQCDNPPFSHKSLKSCFIDRHAET
jgi:hypothetical protein